MELLSGKSEQLTNCRALKLLMPLFASSELKKSSNAAMDDILKDYNNVVQVRKDPCVPELVLHSGILIDSLVFATPRLE